ncbi:MAG TPA: DsbA family protein [Steroidobacteraceae bacterium]|nr:DsbA family protein [Steroidobacteraceae bacterium]
MAGATLLAGAGRRAEASPAQRGAPPVRGPLTPFLGNAHPSKVMAVYFDYHCPYCREMDPLLPVLARRNPQLQILLKEFPVLEADSQVGARIALAAQLRGKFLQTHERLMKYSGDYTGAVATEIARWLGVDPDAFRKDMGDPRIEAELRMNAAEAQARGVNGTPGILTDAGVHSGGLPLERLQAMVNAA